MDWGSPMAPPAILTPGSFAIDSSCSGIHILSFSEILILSDLCSSSLTAIITRGIGSHGILDPSFHREALPCVCICRHPVPWETSVPATEIFGYNEYFFHMLTCSTAADGVAAVLNICSALLQGARTAPVVLAAV